MNRAEYRAAMDVLLVPLMGYDTTAMGMGDDGIDLAMEACEDDPAQAVRDIIMMENEMYWHVGEEQGEQARNAMRQAYRDSTVAAH